MYSKCGCMFDAPNSLSLISLAQSSSVDSLFNVCERHGLVNEGMRFFYSMDEYYGVTPNLEHLHVW
ncbi:hypothetical protein DKX38_021909 [Salix brachista]|uniref:Uncharacterized protein n=1 Tax=Salix brachista TaxID=2182728 RepID=A0A5N5K399_9ROSI|nr:hypothetical protein DKX38_021909 [Salix brachista]